MCTSPWVNLAMDLSTSIFSGIISAVLVTFMYWLTKFLWVKQLRPFWENLLYSDIRINGTWIAQLTTPVVAEYKEEVTVNQTGHKIDGTIICTVGPDLGRKYKFSGTFRNSMLSAFFWVENSTTLDTGSFSLRIENNGSRLAGFTTYYFDDDHKLVSREYIWMRK